MAQGNVYYIVMRHANILIAACALWLFTGCSDNDAPDYPVYMQPSSITSSNEGGSTQTFEYDDYGRIVRWTEYFDDNDRVSARYSYPDANTIVAESEVTGGDIRMYKETIVLDKGRAASSEGTFICRQEGNDGFRTTARKTYRLSFDYDWAGHLTVVKHSEVTGIGDDMPDNAWDNAWEWENYLIWDNGNLVEFQDKQGRPEVYSTTKYKYVASATDYPLIMPASVINCYHHIPLLMKGVFGTNSTGLLSEATEYDRDGNVTMSNAYDYRIEDGRIAGYTHTPSYASAAWYNVAWTDGAGETPR